MELFDLSTSNVHIGYNCMLFAHLITLEQLNTKYTTLSDLS